MKRKEGPGGLATAKKKSGSIIKGGSPLASQEKKVLPGKLEEKVESPDADQIAVEAELAPFLAGQEKGVDAAHDRPGKGMEAEPDLSPDQAISPVGEAVVSDEQDKAADTKEAPDSQEGFVEIADAEKVGEDDGNGAVFEEAETDLHPVDLSEEETPVPPFEPEEQVVRAQAVPEVVEKKDEEVVTRVCPECGKTMIVKGDRFGLYWACTDLPACRYIEKCKEGDGADATVCPLCRQSRLAVKKTPAGKDMFVCPGHSCEFMAWSRPHAIHCPLCSSPFLVEKKEISGETILRCPKAGCRYSQGADGRQQSAKAPVKKKKVVVRRKKGSGTGTGGGKRKVVVRRRKK
ncbi:MAG: type I DNA topoisomerase [Thermodesulfobacteriota bacterium]